MKTKQGFLSQLYRVQRLYYKAALDLASYHLYEHSKENTRMRKMRELYELRLKEQINLAAYSCAEYLEEKHEFNLVLRKKLCIAPGVAGEILDPDQNNNVREYQPGENYLSYPFLYNYGGTILSLYELCTAIDEKTEVQYIHEKQKQTNQ